jgi:phosphatidylglycerol lysyltransferase
MRTATNAVGEGGRSWLRWLPFAIPVLIFALAIFGLHRLAGEFRLRDVMAAYHAIPGRSMLLAMACAAASYGSLTLCERLGVRHAGGTLPYQRVAATSFLAYAVGHNVGFSALSGGAIRYRLYSAMGLSALQIGQVIVFSALTFGLGSTLLLGLSLLLEAGQAASLIHVSVVGARLMGALLVLVLAGWAVFTALHPGEWTLRGRQLRLPGPVTTLKQMAIAAIDYVMAAATMYLLLPADAGVLFPAFAGLFIVAVAVGAVSAVPGGLGVFEAVFVLLLPTVPPQQLLGVLVAYRLIYFLLPFLLAVVGLLIYELRRQKDTLTRVLGRAARPLGFIAPQIIAFLTFGAGMLLLLSGSTPEIPRRLANLAEVMPLPVLELSHLAGSAIGVGLLILAHGLYRRLDGAWLVSVLLLIGGIVASLAKGLDWEEALLLSAVLLVLLATRREFHRKVSLVAEPLSGAWLVSMLIAIGAAIAIGMLAYREVPYRTELWWQFAFDANAPRMLRGGLVAAIVLGIFALRRLLGPAGIKPSELHEPTAGEVERAIAASADSRAWLALTGDKRLLWSASGNSFVMYGSAGRSLIAMGEPVAINAAERRELIWRFRELADESGRHAAFYEIGPQYLAEYVDAGFALSKLGEEALVPLADFSLQGSKRSGLRYDHRRGQKAGLEFTVLRAEQVVAVLPRLREISDQWLAERQAAEKGFSLGNFDETYLARMPVAVAHKEGVIQAFANLWSGGSGEELSMDLMRHATDAPRGAMDFLIVEILLWGKAQGFRWFSLGMSPLAGLELHRLAPAWHKLGNLVYRFGDSFYNFEGLRSFKEKFDPQWRPRYLAAPGGIDLARVLLDVTRLISGGLHRVIFK